MRLPLLCGLMLVSALAGCNRNFTWEVVSTAEAVHFRPSYFLERSEGEVWAFGSGVARRLDGEWSLLDVCGPHRWHASRPTSPRLSTHVAFRGEEVWALCGGDLEEGQTLVIHQGGEGRVTPMPNDGRITFIRLPDGPLLMGSTSLWARDGDSWTAVGSHPFGEARYLHGGGTSRDDFYVGLNPDVDGWQKFRHWNGADWSDVPLDEIYVDISSVELRRGVPMLRHYRLEGGALVDVAEGIPGAAKRPVKPVAFVPPDGVVFLAYDHGHSIELGGTGAYLWFGRAGQEELDYLGEAPFITSGGLYQPNVGDIPFAVDRDTLLGVMQDSLLEGSR